MNADEKRKVFEELLEEYQDVISSEFSYEDGEREAERKAWLNKYDGIKEPLIKDKKIRNLVREWIKLWETEDRWLVRDNNSGEILIARGDIELYLPLSYGIKDGEYTIAELCGEEEE